MEHFNLLVTLEGGLPPPFHKPSWDATGDAIYFAVKRKWA